MPCGWLFRSLQPFRRVFNRRQVLSAFAPVAMGHHAAVKIFDAVASGAFKEERENTVEEASEAGENHLAAKAERHAHMLGIGLAYACRMLGEGAFDHGGGQSLSTVNAEIKSTTTKVKIYSI